MRTYKIKYYILIMLCTAVSNFVYSCEPATPDWLRLFQAADKNKNNFIEKNDWLTLNLLKEPIPWIAPPSKNDPKRLSIFDKLDDDKNGKLNKNEFGEGVYTYYFTNPCAELEYQDQIKPDSIWYKFKNILFKN
ncbi:EF-hand domain-containing protein [Acinetobacter nematophilus]|uniref:EF-hand domain-containing protein n=1 Tax=Acinetobacter nematophilus TaxID=2994642 RepID=A0A9X3DRY6_9GAMM|nr:EF-hand domain-containing protein [Acinetobacter nematophilus]MCX5466876.1 EF-hand domain-containing protein [Acinetobacter nematophilus]